MECRYTPSHQAYMALGRYKMYNNIENMAKKHAKNVDGEPRLIDEEEPPYPPRGAQLLDASYSKEDAVVPIMASWGCPCMSRVSDMTPIVEGDWLSDKDIMAWLTNMLCDNEVGEPHAWVLAKSEEVCKH